MRPRGLVEAPHNSKMMLEETSAIEVAENDGWMDGWMDGWKDNLSAEFLLVFEDLFEAQS